MKTIRPLALIFSALALLGCGSRSSLEIVAEQKPAPGTDPGGLAWIAEPSIALGDPARWKTNAVGVAFANDNQPASAVVVLSPADGEILRCVRVLLTGPSGHQAAPETPASVLLWRIRLDSFDAVLLGQESAMDSSLAAYEKTHETEACAAQDEIVDASIFRYQITISNETGFGSLPGLMIAGARRGIVSSS